MDNQNHAEVGNALTQQCRSYLLSRCVLYALIVLSGGASRAILSLSPRAPRAQLLYVIDDV